MMALTQKKPQENNVLLLEKIRTRQARAMVVGMGYVGLPLATTAASGGFTVVGLDIDRKRVEQINRKKSYIGAVSDETLKALITSGKLEATAEASVAAQADVIMICVPTPLTHNREPDLSHVESTMAALKPYFRVNQLIVLESTTYPGTTREKVIPVLEDAGFAPGQDIFVAYAPEREDPGNTSFNTKTVPKIVGADDAASRLLAEEFYGAFLDTVVPVSSLDTAEAVKLTENIFRSVNIALVNELKTIYEPMGIDIWEVIEAAKTKPFGYMPFYPGPGLGGHCIPIDPFYLTWRARAFEITTRFIELAGEINTRMPYYVVNRTALALDKQGGKGLSRARVLMMGVAYKKNVGDMRQSPGVKIMRLLESRGATVDYCDPHVPALPDHEECEGLAGRRSVDPKFLKVGSYDAVIIVTDHDDVDYAAIARDAKLIIDTRNRMKDFSGTVVKA